jgi:peptidoglycan hydrolase CwlO-like protein
LKDKAKQQIMSESSDRLDRIEKLVESNTKMIESNAKAIVALTDQSSDLNNKLDRLANIVLKLANNQEDHEDRITRLEQQ